MRDRLPADPHDRLVEAVRRSLPNPTVPDDCADYPEHAARKRAEARNDRALMYASMEDITDRCLQAADNVTSSGVVLDINDPADDDSLVQSIDAIEDTLDDDFAPIAARSRY